MTTPRIEEEIDEIIDALVADVHFEKTWPAHTAYYQIDLNQFQEKLRQALTQAHQAGDKDGYERGRKAGRDEAVGILKQIEYDVDVDKKPTIAEEAWANQYESKAEAFWYGECEGLKVFKEAIECIKALQDNK